MSTMASPISHQKIKIDETRVKIEDKIEEEAEDSGMEKEDSVCNIELSDLKKVRLYFIDLFISLESRIRAL